MVAAGTVTEITAPFPSLGPSKKSLAQTKTSDDNASFVDNIDLGEWVDESAFDTAFEDWIDSVQSDSGS